MCLFKKHYPFMYKVEVFDMKCGMCEAHIQDVIRKNFNIKKVKANRFKNKVIIESDEWLDTEKIKIVISSTGYKVGKTERVI